MSISLPPNGPGRIKKYYDVISYYPQSNSLSVWRIPVNFPQENKMFQRPSRSVSLQSYCFATTVVTYSPHRQDYRGDFYYFSNQSGNQWPTLTLPEFISGNFWLLVSLWYMKVKITDVLFTDRKWFWQLLFRRFSTDFGLKIIS